MRENIYRPRITIICNYCIPNMHAFPHSCAIKLSIVFCCCCSAAFNFYVKKFWGKTKEKERDKQKNRQHQEGND